METATAVKDVVFNKKWHYGIVFKSNGFMYIPYFEESEYLASIYGCKLIVSPKGFYFYEICIPAIRPNALKYFLTAAGVRWETWQGKDISFALKSIYTHLRSMFKNKFENMFPFPNNRKLRHHQIDTLMFGVLNKQYMAALDQGTGKTITTICKSLYKSLYPTLIVCEASAKENWRQSLIRDWGFNEFDFTVVYAQNKYLTRALRERYIIINYDLLARYREWIASKGIQHIILDECQRVKNTTSQRYKSLNYIVSQNPEAHITYASGTPVTNRMDDMYAYLKLAKHPRGENKRKFDMLFLEASDVNGQQKVTGSKNLGLLRVDIANFLIRYRLEDCWDMPKKNFIVYNVDLGDWKAMYDDMIKEISEKEYKSRAELENNIHTLNRIISMAKVSIIKELIDVVLESGRKFVAFGSYTDPIKALFEHYPNSAFIDGSVPSHKRAAEITKFREDDNCTGFIGNMQAAGTSIELQNSSDVLFLNWPFVPTTFAQAVSRVYRAGQTKPVNVYTILVKDTVDEYIWKIMENKMKDIDKLIDGKNVSMQEEDIVTMIYEKILQER